MELPAGAQAGALEGVAFPAVVKPLGLSGSRGVIRVNTPAELDAAIARVRALLARKDVRALRSGLDATLLVEGYIDGPEFAIEGVLTEGRLQAFAIFDKPDPLDGPFFEETIYVTPSALDAGVQAAVIAQVERATRALGLAHGPVHAECRVARDAHLHPRGRRAADRRIVFARAALHPPGSGGFGLARGSAAAPRDRGGRQQVSRARRAPPP